MGYKMTPDSQVTGLFKRPTAKGDKWVVRSRIKGGSNTTVTIGFCSIFSVAQARALAKEHLATMAQGINPNHARKVKQAKGMTLSQAIEQYFSEKRTRLKPSTIRTYKSTLGNNFDSWMNRPISSITPQECTQRYLAIKEEVALRSKQKAKANEPGQGEANKAMRTLHAVFQYFTSDMLPDNSGRLLPFGNPVDGLTDKRIKTQLKPRTRALSHIERVALLEFLTHPSHYYDEFMRPKAQDSKAPVKYDHTDWLIMILCTGLRREEPLKLKWEHVDFKGKTYTITETKNGQPLTLPMTARIEGILSRRAEELRELSPYVFPQRANLSKPATMNRVYERLSRMSGIDFTPHDLRRTAATALKELSYSIEDIGRILNHRKTNVTEHYIQTTAEHMREALQELESILFDDKPEDLDIIPPVPEWD